MSKSETFDYSAAAKSLHERLEKQKHLRHERYRKAQADAERIIQMIARKYNPTRIYQWGSLLDPERFDENSDIDIAVEGNDGPERFFAKGAKEFSVYSAPLWQNSYRFDRTMSPTNAEYENLTLEEAQEHFRQLAEKQRERCLWFMNPSIPLDITRPDADRILDQIARKAPRSAWMEVRKLKKWRSRNIK